VLVGLSGGIDSAVVAAIAVDALGTENVLGVSMPGPFHPRAAGRRCHTGKESQHPVVAVPITEVFEEYLHSLGPRVRKPAGGRDGGKYSSAHPRDYLMALSNKFGSMVLSTGNKSEIAVGYCTLYGDMAGGLAVISDVRS